MIHRIIVNKLQNISTQVRLAFICFSLVGTFFSAANAQQPAVKEWTFLVYMNADNNLYQYGFLNIAQMEKLGSTDKVNLIVQMDHGDRSTPTTRYYITRNPNSVPGKINSQVLETMGETNMGDPKTLSEFLTWGVQKFPAKHYAVIIWNHGSGWEGVSYDDNPQAHLTLPNVRKALEVGQSAIGSQRRGSRQAARFDIINFDACLMSALEIAYELKDVGQYLVGSQFNEPGEGENYTTFLSPLIAQPQKSAKELAEIMVYQYALNYKGSSSINYAAIDLNRVQGFTSMVNQSSQAMAGSALKAALRDSFGSGSFDLITAFTRAQMTGKADPKVQQSLDQLLMAYGYPQDFQQSLSRGAGLAGRKIITRTFPGVVYFKAGGSVNQVALKLDQNNLYSAEIPQQTTQYTVQRQVQVGLRGEARQWKESTSTFLRQGNDPIVYHNAFPETSPLIADAYTFSTKGAHGMTLYSLAGASASLSAPSRNIGRGILNEYKQLRFASQGAPAWTAFFGL